VRAQHERNTLAGDKLWSRLGQSEPVGEVEFLLPAAPGRPARLVRQTLYRQVVTLPARRGAPELTVTAVLAREENHPWGKSAGMAAAHQPRGRDLGSGRGTD